MAGSAHALSPICWAVAAAASPLTTTPSCRPVRSRWNSSAFGLYDYVWSKNVARAFEVAKRLRTGNVGVNTTQRNHETPFGGFKLSGVGRDGGSFGLHCYSEMQSILWPS